MIYPMFFYANGINNIHSKNKWFPYEFNIDVYDFDCKIQILEISQKILNILEIIGDKYFYFFEGEENPQYKQVKNDLFEAIINAIKTAKNNTVINTDKIVFFVSMFSENGSSGIEVFSAKQLNDKSILDDFLKCYS